MKLKRLEDLTSLDERYALFKDRQRQRRLAFSEFVVFFAIVALIIFYSHRLATPVYNVIFIVLGISILINFWYIISRSWAQETAETSIFVNAYDATKLLNSFMGGNEFSLGKAERKVRGIVDELSTISGRLESTNSTLVKNKVSPSFEGLATSLSTQILPRIRIKKELPEMILVLKGLAQLFAESSDLSAIDLRVKALQKYSPVGEKKTPNAIHVFLSKDVPKAIMCCLVSFVVFIAIIGLYSVLSANTFVSILDNADVFVGILSISVVAGLGIYALIRKK